MPRPGPGEVLIKVAAAGVNRPDVLQRRGLYPPPPGAPSIPGLEVAGEIAAAGEGVPAELIGQPVCALIAGGGYAEYAVAPVGQCLPVPAALTMVEAAAMPETLFTVWTNLFERAYATEGETALVHGGTSGIGTMAIALGRPVRPQDHRHLRQRREMPPRRGAGASRCDQLPDAGFRRGGEAADRRRRRRTSCSTWSAATICRAIWIASPRTAATSRSRSSAAPSARSTSPG